MKKELAKGDSSLESLVKHSRQSELQQRKKQSQNKSKSEAICFCKTCHEILYIIIFFVVWLF